MEKATKKSLRRWAIGLVLLGVIAYFVPYLVIFYLICGLYDLSRNKNLNLQVVEQYFFGNGMFTWVLSPLNILLDILSLPYVNKGVYKLQDLPADYQAEVKRLITATQKENIVGQLQARAEQQARSMFFFKWYGKDQPSFANVPSFYEKYNFVKTIGVSVFNKKNSTSKHFGPIRATIRVLYNINDMNDRTAYIWCGDKTSYWKDDKLFIFDDTLMHQSVNQTDQTRYCLFVDILRPSYLPGLFAAIVSFMGVILKGSNSIFYKNWKVIQK
jgi:aspartyl/asparaginyl beta-hydroxylase (cupin superfamily)